MGKVNPNHIEWGDEIKSEVFQPIKKQKPNWESRQDKKRDKSFKSHRQYPKKWDNT